MSRGEHKSRVFKNMVLRGIFGPKKDGSNTRLEYMEKPEAP
jgi:hypothetical protein